MTTLQRRDALFAGRLCATESATHHRNQVNSSVKGCVIKVLERSDNETRVEVRLIWKLTDKISLFFHCSIVKQLYPMNANKRGVPLKNFYLAAELQRSKIYK